LLGICCRIIPQEGSVRAFDFNEDLESFSEHVDYRKKVLKSFAERIVSYIWSFMDPY
jgi:hypothetical protein